MTRVLSVTTLKAYTILHANQDILEMAFNCTGNYRSNNPDEKTWNELSDNVVGVINDEGFLRVI